MSVMSDFFGECFPLNLLNSCLLLAFRNYAMSNSSLFLSNYKNIVHNLLWCSPQLKNK